MRNWSFAAFFIVFFAFSHFSAAPVMADILQKPKIAAPCKQCHKPDENILRGFFEGVSNKGNIIRMKAGHAVWLVKYSDHTTLTGAENWTKIPREREIAIAITQKDGELFAVSVILEPMVKVPLERYASAGEVARLVAAGPEKGNFQLVDSRSSVLYNEGHIPGAISIPDREFNKFAWRLPKEHDKLIIFYCSSPAGRLGVLSMGKAEKMGYTRVKNFNEGMYGWKRAGNLVVSSVQNYRESLEKDIPVVLVDLRPADEARRGHIINAVSIPGRDIPNSREKFPLDRSAPIILYDNDTRGATDDFMTVKGWGYTNVSVLEGGFEEWKRSGELVINGDVATRIVYSPRLRMGEIGVEEFRRTAETFPSDKLILDVRDRDEVMQGMIKGALNIPVDDIKGSLEEIPADKEIVTYSVDGIRAEAAYLILKAAGYKVRFLNAVIRIEKDGKFAIVKE